MLVRLDVIEMARLPCACVRAAFFLAHHVITPKSYVYVRGKNPQAPRLEAKKNKVYLWQGEILCYVQCFVHIKSRHS